MAQPTSVPASKTQSRSSSRGRRSFPALHQLSIAPLSSVPITSSANSPGSEDNSTHPSYLVGKSAPTTPGIFSLSSDVSRSQQRQSRRVKHGYFYEGHFASSGSSDVYTITKAKSSSALLASQADSAPHPSERRAHFSQEVQSVTPAVAPRPKPHRASSHNHNHKNMDDTWLHRAGIAIATTTRDSRGQSWLTSRASSTSNLLHLSSDFAPERIASTTHIQARSHATTPTHNGSHHHFTLTSGENFADDEYSTPTTPRAGSSRYASARNSRRGSKHHVDAMSLATIHQYPTHRSGTQTPAAEPDFVNLEGEDAAAIAAARKYTYNDDSDSASSDDGSITGDEREIAELSRERGFGVGGWVDRLIGWTLFSVNEEGRDSDSDSEAESQDGPGSSERTHPQLISSSDLEEQVRRKRAEMNRQRRKQDRDIFAKQQEEREVIQTEAKHGHLPVQPPIPAASNDTEPEAEGGWQDAAWLLSVATKVLL